MMEHKILIAGFGGQGVMLMGQLLCLGAFLERKKVLMLPAYGGEQRGGTSNCTIIISDEDIGSPSVRRYDTIAAMNQPSFNTFHGFLREGGQILTNKSMVELPEEDGRTTAVEIPILETAARLGSERAANMVMLGALTAACGMVGKAFVQQAVVSELGKKRPDMIELNLAALDAGYSIMSDPCPVK